MSTHGQEKIGINLDVHTCDFCGDKETPHFDGTDVRYSDLSSNTRCSVCGRDTCAKCREDENEDYCLCVKCGRTVYLTDSDDAEAAARRKDNHDPVETPYG